MDSNPGPHLLKKSASTVNYNFRVVLSTDYLYLDSRVEIYDHTGALSVPHYGSLP